MANQTRSTVWIDLYGRTRQTVLKGNASLGAVQAAIAAVSDAALLDCWEGPPMGPSGLAIAGPYNAVADEVLLTFQDAAASLVTVTIPAPDPTIFKPDNRTVDPTVAAMVTLIAAVTGTVLSAGGLPVASYVSGFRQPQKSGYY